jgi:signal peptidase II
VSGTGSKSRSVLNWLWLSLVVIVLDQAAKALIASNFELYEVVDVLPVFEITRLHNTGAAFSLLAGASGWQRWFFICLATAVSGGIIYWLRHLPRDSAAFLPAALALVLGGALGNLVDRVWHGYVIDFLHFHWDAAYFPAFNVADSAITIGAGLLILDAILEGRRSRMTRDPS